MQAVIMNIVWQRWLMLAMNSLARPTYCWTCFFSSVFMLELLRCKSAASRVYIGLIRSMNHRLSMTSISNSSFSCLVIVTSGVMYIARVSRSLALVAENPCAGWGFSFCLTNSHADETDWSGLTRAALLEVVDWISRHSHIDADWVLSGSATRPSSE